MDTYIKNMAGKIVGVFDDTDKRKIRIITPMPTLSIRIDIANAHNMSILVIPYNGEDKLVSMKQLITNSIVRHSDYIFDVGKYFERVSG